MTELRKKKLYLNRFSRRCKDAIIWLWSTTYTWYMAATYLRHTSGTVSTSVWNLHISLVESNIL